MGFKFEGCFIQLSLLQIEILILCLTQFVAEVSVQSIVPIFKGQ